MKSKLALFICVAALGGCSAVRTGFKIESPEIPYMGRFSAAAFVEVLSENTDSAMLDFGGSPIRGLP